MSKKSTRQRAFVFNGLIGLLIKGVTWTFPLDLPPGVFRKSAWIACGQDRRYVDFYFKKDLKSGPLVVVTHGFAQSKR